MDAEKVVNALMTNSFGDVALRLQLRGPGEQDLGGMNRDCVKRIITDAIEEETQALRAQVEELREGLKPFASEYFEWGRASDETIPDIKSPEDDGFDSAVFTVGDLHRAFDLVDRVEAETGKADGWISVKDRLPEKSTWDKSNWVWANFRYDFEGSIWEQGLCRRYGNGNIWSAKDSPSDIIITHWMPLPDPPATDTP